jgi:uncharacterized delta-60 repeat protein
MRKKLLKIGVIIGVISPSVSFSQDGTLDVSFGTSGLVEEVNPDGALDMALQSDGKIVAVSSIYIMGIDDMAIVRYNTDGTPDNSFGTNGVVNVDFAGVGDHATAVAIQSDGKIVAVGSSGSDIAVIRLNTDGTLDNTFATGGKYTLDINNASAESAWDVALQSDGKIVVVATGGTDMFCREIVIRLNTDGTPDVSFNGDGMFSPFCIGMYNQTRLSSIAIQSDGKILVGGSKNNNFAVTRINTDGTIDNTYGTSGTYSVTTPVVTECKLEIQDDDKLVATYSSASQTEVRLVRLNTNGTEDTGFGVNGTVTTQIATSSYNYEFTKGLTIQSDGKIIAVGSAYTNGTTSDYLVIRYNSDGSIDNSFGTSGNGIVTTSIENLDEDRGLDVKIQTDGKILLAGAGCTGSCDFVLLRYNNTAGTNSSDELTASEKFSVFPNPAEDKINLVCDLNTIADVYDISGRILESFTLIKGVNTFHIDFPAGIYIIKNRNTGSEMKLVVN